MILKSSDLSHRGLYLCATPPTHSPNETDWGELLRGAVLLALSVSCGLSAALPLLSLLAIPVLDVRLREGSKLRGMLKFLLAATRRSFPLGVYGGIARRYASDHGAVEYRRRVGCRAGNLHMLRRFSSDAHRACTMQVCMIRVCMMRVCMMPVAAVRAHRNAGVAGVC